MPSRNKYSNHPSRQQITAIQKIKTIMNKTKSYVQLHTHYDKAIGIKIDLNMKKELPRLKPSSKQRKSPWKNA